MLKLDNLTEFINIDMRVCIIFQKHIRHKVYLRCKTIILCEESIVFVSQNRYFKRRNKIFIIKLFIMKLEIIKF